jgi:hypothetical protein
VALTHGLRAPVTSATVGRLIAEHAEHVRLAAQRLTVHYRRGNGPGWWTAGPTCKKLLRVFQGRVS